VISRCHRAVLGFLAISALSLPLLSAALAAPAPAKPKGDPKLGKTAFSKEGCAGCHKTKDYPMGGDTGPDLKDVAKEHTAAQISAYIKKPKSGSVMPPFKGPVKTLEDLTAYMLTQK
jgi:mono/diheme cytochrome c family protein